MLLNFDAILNAEEASNTGVGDEVRRQCGFWGWR